jgi:ABC-type nitrate/sulfonate/bicarbonate transport system substrate-binding protein
MKKQILVTLIAFALITLGFNAQSAEKVPSFTLAWSEYVSWSVFGVADVFQYIDGREGKMGPIEEKWNVDIILIEAEYDPCIGLYASGQCDAVCITNMDVLNPAMSRPSVVFMPTSTSYGGDGCLVVKGVVTDITSLKDIPVYLLEATVSQYLFERKLEIQGENIDEYRFVNMDPGAAAMAMQQKQSGYDAIVVWNPFVLSTLDKRSDVYTLFDSRTIPGEIIDLVVMAKSSLEKSGASDFACAVIDTFYAVNARLADPATKEETTVEIGRKFSNLNYVSMRKALLQTRFYENAEQALSLFTGGDVFPGGTVETDGNLQDIMKRVITFCQKRGIVDGEPTVAYGNSDNKVNLLFDPQYIQRVIAGK